MAGKPQTLATTSAFEILGPVMVGPSSSHTAGALRCAQVAASLLEGRITKVTFGLWNSFAHTCRGHGTDRALLAGVMGFAPDDLRIRDSFQIAQERGLQYSFRIDTATEVPHPNTVGITLAGADGHSVHVTGVSIGGGSVRLRELDGVEIDLSGEYDTIVVKQYDKPGVVAFITKTLSESGVNIAFMRLYRENRGKIAYTIVEADQPIHRETVRTIFEHPDIVAARRITPREEADR